MRTKGTLVLGAVTLLAAGSALAGILFVPVGGRFVDLDLAPVELRARSNRVMLETTDLNSELDCPDQPPDETFVPLTQQLRLSFDPRDGKVSGTVLGSMDRASAELALRGTIDGIATCAPLNGTHCGHIVVDLEVRGTFVDLGDPERPGLFNQRLLGSLVRDGDSARWVAAEFNLQLGGARLLIQSVLDTMDEGDSCGV